MTQVALQTTFGMMQLLKHLYSLPFQTLCSLPCGLQLLLQKNHRSPVGLESHSSDVYGYFSTLDSQVALDAYIHEAYYDCVLAKALMQLSRLFYLSFFCYLEGSRCHVGPVPYLSALWGILATLGCYICNIQAIELNTMSTM